MIVIIGTVTGSEFLSSVTKNCSNTNHDKMAKSILRKRSPLVITLDIGDGCMSCGLLKLTLPKTENTVYMTLLDAFR